MHDALTSGELSWDTDVGRPFLAGESGIFPVLDLITVFIAEAHVALRQGLNRFLVQQQDMQVIGDAADGRQVLRGMEALQPHTLLLDLRMPKLGSDSV